MHICKLFLKFYKTVLYFCPSQGQEIKEVIRKGGNGKLQWKQSKLKCCNIILIFLTIPEL